MLECVLEVEKGYRKCCIRVISPDGIRVVTINLPDDIVGAVEKASEVLLEEQACIARQLLPAINDYNEAGKAEFLINHKDFIRKEYDSYSLHGYFYPVVYFVFKDGSRIKYDSVDWEVTGACSKS